MVVAEEVDGVVEGVGKVGRETEEVAAEVMGTKCWNNDATSHLRAPAIVRYCIPEKLQLSYNHGAD